MSHLKSYTSRAAQHSNPSARHLLELMDRKKTNLSASVDVTTKAELLRIADECGPYICVLKTHIDIISDFDDDLVTQLIALAEKHEFLIFEDRKFADIGNTVKLQYSSGVHKIASWAHITNAHIIPGEGIVHGLAEVGVPLNRALLLLAEMSSAGSLATGNYTLTALDIARRNRNFCVGFIGQRRLENGEEDFIYMTPGVGLVAKGDGLGQQYRTPRQVVFESGCDVIIVGRGIYGGGNTAENCRLYREAGWNAYLERIAVKPKPIVTHILFDMDGLLLDTERVYSEVTSEILARYGKTFDWALKSQMMGVKEGEAAAKLIEYCGLEGKLTAEEYLRERNAMQSERFPFCVPLPGVLRLVKHLKDTRIPICVATSSHRHAFDLKSSKNSELFGYFEGNITCGDDKAVVKGKPAPDIFLASAKSIGFHDADFQKCLVFEDAPSGVLAGLNAGMQVVWIPDPNLELDPVLTAQCAKVLRTMEDFDPSEFGLPAF
ncbi:orotidine 5'-phosphate decarboxylase [Physocladia obscura]|uniref:Orotidine 5'-phosphate decarboxylase n=1 Tax=Physocladia obscura TaxID=109957 RepID=A0AAD5XF76_9FUNG|nr:orotidine 5'-phosphate decarboxylase [Physocladia obscura]